MLTEGKARPMMPLKGEESEREEAGMTARSWLATERAPTEMVSRATAPSKVPETSAEEVEIRMGCSGDQEREAKRTRDGDIRARVAKSRRLSRVEDSVADPNIGTSSVEDDQDSLRRSADRHRARVLRGSRGQFVARRGEEAQKMYDGVVLRVNKLDAGRTSLDDLRHRPLTSLRLVEVSVLLDGLAHLPFDKLEVDDAVDSSLGGRRRTD